MIYFDNSATTPVYPQVLEVYQKVTQDYWGNPSSLHDLGVQANRVLDRSRQNVAGLLGVLPTEVIFTSSGTEGNNWVIKGTALEKRVYGNHLITSKIEHPSVLRTMKQLEEQGFEVTYLDVDDKGEVMLDQLVQALRKDTILVSIMAVNNEIGSVQPIREIGRILEDYPWIHFHVDGVQAVGLNQALVTSERIDFLTLSAHKFHGPRGVGIVYKKKNKKIQALLSGGGQEFGYRSSTENVAGIVATTKALRMSLEEDKHTETLRKELWDFLAQQEAVRIFSPKNGAPHIICFALKGVKGEVLVHALEEKDIYLSTTSACSSKKNDHSSTLGAMNIDDAWASGAVRLSLSNQNTLAEVAEFKRVFSDLIKKFNLFRYK